MSETGKRHRIVVVGGGAGGLVLATRLGRRLGRGRRAEITLVDASLTHIWKPLLHEIAAGTLPSNQEYVDFLAHARRHRYRYQYGGMDGLDRRAKRIHLAPVADDNGTEAIPARTLEYDTLVIAVGSTSNDFGIPGVSEYCDHLDNQRDAELLQQRSLIECLRANVVVPSPQEPPLSLAVVGAGATGVEFAAEMHKAVQELVAYGLSRIEPHRDATITVIEAADRVLPALPPRISAATHDQLTGLGIEVLTEETVSEVDAEGIHTASGGFVRARTKLWCAGIKAPDFLRDLDGLEVNQRNQLVVTRELRTTRDEDIFALGDCSACPLPDGEGMVPPRAQAAQQQAVALARNLERRLRGEALKPFVYRDYGSLVSLSHNAVGNVMGKAIGSVTLEGGLARMAYVSLYRKHQFALHGMTWLGLMSFAKLIGPRGEPRLKLH